MKGEGTGPMAKRENVQLLSYGGVRGLLPRSERFWRSRRGFSSRPRPVRPHQGRENPAGQLQSLRKPPLPSARVLGHHQIYGGAPNLNWVRTLPLAGTALRARERGQPSWGEE